MSALSSIILRFALPTLLFVAPLKAETVMEALPDCIATAEQLSQFGLAFQSAMDEMGEFNDARTVASLVTGAFFTSRYVEVLGPLLEEEAAHDRLIDALSAIEAKRSEFENLTTNMIEELYADGSDYQAKAQFISQCAQAAFQQP